MSGPSAEPAPGRKRLDDTGRPDSLSTRFRQRRDVRLRTLIASIAAEKGSIRILDLGGTPQYWERVGISFLRENSAHVTILNYVADQLGAENKHPDLFSTSVGDACDLAQFPDNAFDLVHSNSVVEHVGNWSRMKRFGAETRRVGRNYYVQTPYYWFPIDPHYYRAPLIHWLPPLASPSPEGLPGGLRGARQQPGRRL